MNQTHSKICAVFCQFFIKDPNIKKIFGILSLFTDVFSYSMNINKICIVPKHIVLSIMSELFDPFGLINSVILIAKLLLPKLSRFKLELDDTFPENHYNLFLKFCKNITEMNKTKFLSF